MHPRVPDVNHIPLHRDLALLLSLAVCGRGMALVTTVSPLLHAAHWRQKAQWKARLRLTTIASNGSKAYGTPLVATREFAALHDIGSQGRYALILLGGL